MVKRRERVTKQTEVTPEKLEEFASGADGGTQKKNLDPHAKRDFKSLGIPFNEYEFGAIEKLAKKTGRSKLSAVRWAILKVADEAGENGE